MIATAHATRPALPIRRPGAAAGASRSWRYARPSEEASAERDTALRGAAERIVLAFPGYGYRRVTRTRQRDGWDIDHERVLRVMREEALVCRLGRRFVRTTDAARALRAYPAPLTGTGPAGPDRVWAADVTYTRSPTPSAYLARVLDGWSRRCLGWGLPRTIGATLTRAALDRALTARRPAAGAIHRSDRGVRHASAPYIARLREAGAHISLPAVGNPRDSAKAESFFATLKREEGDLGHRRLLPSEGKRLTLPAVRSRGSVRFTPTRRSRTNHWTAHL